MVKKLFKYEISAYLRVWIPVELILIAVAVFGRVTQFFESDNLIYELVTFLAILIFVGCLLASIVFTFIFAFIRYYKNLFTSEGYLSFTLPVTPGQHIFVKLATSVLFSVASLIVAFIAFMIMTAGDVFAEVMKAVGYLSNLAIEKTGIHFWLYLLEMIVFLTVSFAATQMLYNTCITIGQKANKGRIGFAFLAYFVYYVISQVVVGAVQYIALILPDETWQKLIELAYKNYIVFIHCGILGITVISLILVLVGFLISRRIISRRLNLI